MQDVPCIWMWERLFFSAVVEYTAETPSDRDLLRIETKQGGIMKSKYIKHNIPVLINISKIVTVHYFEFNKKFNSDGEQHDFWEFVYADKGEINIIAGNKSITLKQGEAYFHKPNEFHKITANGIVAPNVFIISFVCNSKAMEYFKCRKMLISFRDKHYISSIIKEANNTYDLPFNNPDLKELKTKLTAPPGGQQVIRNYLELFLITLIRNDEKNRPKYTLHSFKSTENRIVPKIIGILEQNIYGEISVAEICGKINYSKTYLSKIFIEATGYSIKQYYTVLKIDEAKRLIREGNYNFTEISNMLNFSEPQYFSKVFKRVTKMSPTKYSESVYN